MSKILKHITIILVLISAFIIVLITYANGAYLSSLDEVKQLGPNSVGSTVWINQYSLEYRVDLYCINHGAALWNSRYTSATVSQYVKIVGNQVYDRNNTLIEGLSDEEKIENAKLAYLTYLGRNVGYGTYGGYSQAQRGIYRNINKWLSTVGARFGLQGWQDPANDWITVSSDTENAMNEYVQSLGNSDTTTDVKDPVDNTVKENVKVGMYYRQVDGVEKAFYNIGPFNWNFTGEIQSFTVTDKENNPIDASKIFISEYEGTNQNFINYTDIKSDRDFYISIDAQEGIEGIKSISAIFKVNNTKEVYSAELWFLNGGSDQRVMLVNPYVDTIDKDLSITTDIPLDFPGNLKLIKLDKDNLTKLPNVQFRFKYRDKYYTKQGGWSTDPNDPNVIWETDGNGEITLTNIPIGTWTWEEVANNNPEYENAEISTDSGTNTIDVKCYLYSTKTEIAREVIKGIYESTEGRAATARLSNEDYVRVAYKAILGRDPDAAGLSGNVAILNNGRTPENERQVLANIYNSDEFKNYFQETDTWRNTFITNLYENVLGRTPSENNELATWRWVLKGYTPYTIYNKRTTGELNIKKVDEYTLNAIANVGFKFQYEATGKYIHMNANGDISYVDSIDDATEFFTDSLGNLHIEGIFIGTYLAYETKAPGDLYAKLEAVEVSTDHEQDVIENKQIYINLSGYVFEDIQAEKQSKRNGLYRDDEFDVNDILVQGVKVRLKEGNTIVKETTTDSNGAYRFEQVLIDSLPNYYIEFEYDGLIYANTTPYLDKANGGKALEGELRNTFNNNFATVENGGANNKVAVKDRSGNTVYNVDYSLNPDTASASIGNTSQLTITANTNNAGYKLEYQKGSGETEIRNINLGIYKRTQADLAMMQDLDQVKIEIAGYGHIYKYANRFEHLEGDEMDYTKDSWNVGVRYKNPYNQLIYTRPIYNSDANYEDENEENELKVALTYKIAIRNEETIAGKVNQVVDYFDKRYEIAGIGTSINEETGLIENALNYTEDTSYSSDTYKKVIINTDILVQASTSNTDETAKTNTAKYIYIQFNLSRDNILNLLNEAKINNNDVSRLPNLENIAEITSYTSYSDAQGQTLYAALDKDSVPQNTEPGNTSTYEDDTDTAPTIAITIANAREVSGTIFEDNAIDESLSDKNIREGNGTLDEGENSIGGVKVQLVEVDDAGNVTDNVAKVFDEQANNGNGEWTDAECSAETTQDGNYSISGYIPGRYAIKYIWGDGTYKIVDGNQEAYTDMVENYKATNLTQSKYESEANNNKFYRDANESEIRTSHALDDYETRQEIDNQLNEHYQYDENGNIITDENGNPILEEGYNHNTEVTINEMTSTTPEMEFHVEYDDNDLTTITYSRITDRVAFKVGHMDFGIIRRPVQSVNFVKTLSKIRITLANGQVLIDGYIDDEGNLQGETGGYLSYVKPVKENGITVQNGYLRAELDSELIQGATVEMEYKLRTENTSNADYTSEGFYNFSEDYYNNLNNGEELKNQEIITITPSRIVDYLDAKSVYKQGDPTNEEYRWRQATIQDLKDMNLVASNVIQALEDGKYQYEENGEIYEEELNETQIFTTDYLDTTTLKPVRMENGEKRQAEGGDVYMVVEKILNTAEDANFTNQAELSLIDKPGGSKIPPTPGNYIPNEHPQEEDEDTSQEVIITPNTGADRNYVLPITISIITIAIIGVGIIIIKRKVIGRGKDT